MGDHIQAIKAGIFEIGDIFVINKADRPDAQKMLDDLQAMIDIAYKKFKKESWKPPILLAEAVNNKGIVELLNEIEKHRKSRRSLSRQAIIGHKKALARFELIDMIKSRLVEETLKRITNSHEFREYLDCIIDGTMDPYSACDDLISAKLNFFGDGNSG